MPYGAGGFGPNPYGGGLPAGAILTPEQLGWVGVGGDYPEAPHNGWVTSPYTKGVLDIRWDNPAILAGNAPWSIVGVNIYRSDVGERGPYYRINTFPVSGGFYRDATQNILVPNEVVRWNSSWNYRGDAPNRPGFWQFRTEQAIVKPSLEDCIYANSPSDVIVTVDGVEVPVAEVFGRTGEVVIGTGVYYDVATDQEIAPVIPTENSQVLVTYHTPRNLVRSTRLDGKTFYRLTSVAASDQTMSGFAETPLDYSQPLTAIRVETLDYQWREAIARNNWILEQGGERVKVFIRKTSGLPCSCMLDERSLEYRKQPSSICMKCYGTGYLGGYEGPWELIIAPPDVERRVAQSDRGRHMEYVYETWTGPSPLLTQRDFVVNQMNERFSIGPVRKPTARGNILQQHFSINYLDEGDIRYQVPISDPATMTFPETRVTIDDRECKIRYPHTEYGPMVPLNGPSAHDPQVFPVDPRREQAVPLSTEKSNIPDSREERGRTAVYENITYAVLLSPPVLWLLKVLYGAAQSGMA